jgi:hypothetical protein
MIRKKCKRCGKKVSSGFTYCPSCGFKMKNQDWGMLGKSDIPDFQDLRTEIKLPAGLDMMFNSLVKNLDKQFKEFDRGMDGKSENKKTNPFVKRSGISISISTSGNKPPKINVKRFGNGKPETLKEKTKEEKSRKKLPGKNLNISKLKKEEPKTNVRRLSDRVIYEIDLPNVKSVHDVSITQLENSIEIKAIAGNKAYLKLIPINLPIYDYKLEKGKLILELENSD